MTTLRRETQVYHGMTGFPRRRGSWGMKARHRLMRRLGLVRYVFARMGFR